MENDRQWQIISKTDSIIDNLKWIDEEDMLLKFSDAPIFEKQPLSTIRTTFIYVDLDGEVVCVLKTAIDVEPRTNLSVLHRADFSDKINAAKRPKQVVDSVSHMNMNWLEKTYIFDSAATYSIPVDHENIDTFNPKRELTPFEFAKDTAKISSSLAVFHDLYEFVIIMREENAFKKSIIKQSLSGKTKKVRISDDSPRQYVFSKNNPVSGKRRTKKNYD
jgi:hypothetical protein